MAVAIRWVVLEGGPGLLIVVLEVFGEFSNISIKVRILLFVGVNLNFELFTFSFFDFMFEGKFILLTMNSLLQLLSFDWSLLDIRLERLSSLLSSSLMIPKFA